MRIGRPKPKYVFVYVIFVLAILTIGLAGRVDEWKANQKTVDVVNGMPLVTSIQYQSLNYTVGYDENYSGWIASEGGTQNGPLFTGVLSAGSSPTSAVFYKSLDVNLAKFPLLSVQIQVEKGVDYGIRFYSGTEMLGNSADVLDHRIGTGSVETIQLNMLLYNDNENATDDVTSVQVYAEHAGSPTPDGFSISLVKMEFLGVGLADAPPSGQFRAMDIDFALPPNSMELTRVSLALTMQAPLGTNFSLYVGNDTAVLSNGNYLYSSTISTYDYSLYPTPAGTAVLDFENAQTFFSILPASNSSIIILANSGDFSSVKIDSFDFFYLKTGIAVFSSADVLLYLYMLVFLFFLPLAVLVLIYEEFVGKKRREVVAS